MSYYLFISRLSIYVNFPRFAAPPGARPEVFIFYFVAFVVFALLALKPYLISSISASVF